MRLKPERAPDAADHRVTHPRLRRHRARTPVRLALGRRLQRLDDHGLDRIIGDRPGRAHPRLVVQPLEPTLDEADPPLAHRGIGGAIAARDRGVCGRVDAREHQPCTKREGPIHVCPLRQAHQLGPLDIRDHQLRLGTSDLRHAPLDHNADHFST